MQTLARLQKSKSVLKSLFSVFIFLFVTGLILIVAGLLEATRTPRIVEERIELQGLTPGEEYRILQITDTQVGLPDLPIARLEKVIAQANSLKPDMIVLTGDYRGGKLITAGRRYEPSLDATLATFAKLKAPLGVFLILGNHDSPIWVPRLLKRHPNLRLLVNDSTTSGPFHIVGLDSAARNMVGFPALFDSLPIDDQPTLILLHEPKQLFRTRKIKSMRTFLTRPSVLAIAGHTHGGQVYTPFYSNRRHAPCRRGLCHIEGWRVFVSSGVGTSGLPIRLGVPPEMAMITVFGPDQASGKNPGTDR